ncbi:MAG: cytidine deaminase [Candidatus Sericytochromatia bacterium]|nr:cytidine deaminase [Candidatus Sericytochromatia bacterium]
MSQLSEDQIQALMQAAHAAYAHAYVPYSGFPVGAAVLVRDPERAEPLIVSGCNVENASFGLAICAERVALTKAISEGLRDFVAVAVVAKNVTPCFPCGTCLQFIREFGADTEIFFEDTQGQRVRHTIGAMLPYAFTAKDLSATAAQDLHPEGEQ